MTDSLLLRVEDGYYVEWYTFEDEKKAVETAKKYVRAGNSCLLYKPYKKFTLPDPVVVEVDVK